MRLLKESKHGVIQEKLLKLSEVVEMRYYWQSSSDKLVQDTRCPRIKFTSYTPFYREYKEQKIT